MSEAGEAPPIRPAKGTAAFRTIGEVADELELPAHVLRFWESKFAQLKPLKRRGGRRYYRPEDIVLLRRIRQCLYQDGYTIRGVQKLLDGGEPEKKAADKPAAPSLFPLDPVPEPAATGEVLQRPAAPARRAPRPPNPQRRAALEEIRRELLEARALLTTLIGR